MRLPIQERRRHHALWVGWQISTNRTAKAVLAEYVIGRGGEWR